MCGLLGIISHKDSRIDHDSLKFSLDLMRHRGPDKEEAIFFSNDPKLETQAIRNVKFKSNHSIFFGHTRLSIIDISETGSQPMSNEDGSIWIIYNGEIYNFPEIKETLAARHKFKSNTDTEVLIHAYEEHGDSFIESLRGMFAFLLFDTKKKRITAVRDPIGIKPLYFYRDPERIILSSEIKPILNLVASPFEVNRQALVDYLSVGYIPTPATPFKTIEKIKPAECLTINLAGESPAIERKTYWNMERASSKASLSENDYLGELDYLLHSTVKGCLISDVPVGIFLSGGMDSSTITFAASRIKEAPIKTFSVGFREHGYDESKYAKEISKICRTDHNHYYVDTNFFEFLSEAVDSTEEPIADPASIPLWFLAREASEQVKVVLSGEGGDEIFGGYTRYFWDKIGRVYSSLPSSLRKALSTMSKTFSDSGEMTTTNIKRRVKKFLASGGVGHPERYLNWFSILSREEIGDLLTEESSSAIDINNLQTAFNSFFSTTDDNPLKNMQFTDLRTMLLDNLLLKADKLSMAHSLEVRVPLLDKKLVDFAMNLPQPMKIKHGQTKYLLRKFLKGKIPSNLFERRKQGFEMPIGKWLLERDWPKTKRKIKNLASDHKLFNSKPLASLLDEHEKGKGGHGRKVYLMLVLSVWFEKYMNFVRME